MCRLFPWWVVACLTLLACEMLDDDSMKHDPEPYKREIQRIEGLLQKSAPGSNDGGQLHVLSAELAKVVGKDIDHYKHREIAMNRLIGFGEHFARLEDGGMAVDLPTARAMWKDVRSELFKEAAWFQSL